MSTPSQNIFNQTEADRPEYKNHKIFEKIKSVVSFYDSFSNSIMHFSTVGTTSVINIDSYLYSSIQGTLESIQLLLENGKIGDAFCLLRKYHDSIILNVYINLYIEKNKNTENLYIKEVQDWLSGKNRLPHDDYRKMSEYIKKSDQLKNIYSVLQEDKSYIETRQRCNDHTHYNSFENVLINDNRVYYTGRNELLNTFQNDLENLFILHFSCIFYLNDHYMVSSDHLDAIEMGMMPEPSSQYWVAPFIQDIFSNLVSVRRSDIAKMIKENTKMELL